MQLQGLGARPRWRSVPFDMGERQAGAVAPNVRAFQARLPTANGLRTSPIWTAENWLYVAVVLDLYSRRIVGSSIRASMTAQFVAHALIMALWRRGKPDALLHHSEGQPIYERAVPAPARTG